MPDLAAYFSLERTLAQAPLRSKKRVLETLSEYLKIDAPENEEDVVSQATIYDGLIKREKLGSTALGKGVAIPNVCTQNLLTPRIAVLSLSEAVDFDAPDDQPVDLFLGLLLPAEQAEQSEKLLHELSDLLHNATFCQSLRDADSDKALYNAVLLSKVMHQN